MRSEEKYEIFQTLSLYLIKTLLNPLETKFNLKYILRILSYSTVNPFLLGYKKLMLRKEKNSTLVLSSIQNIYTHSLGRM
jgi:hypothetical protein